MSFGDVSSHVTSIESYRRNQLKLLLTSAGIKNPSIHGALVDLLGKPIEDSNALIVPTAIYPFLGGAGMAWRAITGDRRRPFGRIGLEIIGHSRADCAAQH